MELISVIIPAYNVEQYIARCLDSVRSQTYRNIEIIVIDDGSEDGTKAICDEYAAIDSRIRVVHKKNAGVAAARNDALDMASGDMIAFADADDYMETDMLEKLYIVMTENMADMVSCGYYEEYPDHVYEHGKDCGTVVFDKFQAYEDYLNMGGRIGAGLWNKLIRSDAIKDLRFKDYKMGEDVELLFRIVGLCNKVVCIDYEGYHYIHREGSATRIGFGLDNLNILSVVNEMLEYIKREHPELSARMYAFHASWYSAQIQVMYWNNNVSKYVYEQEFIRAGLKKACKGYRNNPYISRTDRLFINSYVLGIYRPIRRIYDIWNKSRSVSGRGTL